MQDSREFVVVAENERARRAAGQYEARSRVLGRMAAETARAWQRDYGATTVGQGDGWRGYLPAPLIIGIIRCWSNSHDNLCKKTFKSHAF